MLAESPTEYGVVPGRQLFDDRIDAGLLCDLFDFLAIAFQPLEIAEGKTLLRRSLEPDWRLPHVRDLVVIITRREISYVGAVEQYTPAVTVGVVEPRNQVRKRRLACPIRPNQGDRLTRSNVEVNPSNRGVVGTGIVK